jgi:hypothetical protein
MLHIEIFMIIFSLPRFNEQGNKILSNFLPAYEFPSAMKGKQP